MRLNMRDFNALLACFDGTVAAAGRRLRNTTGSRRTYLARARDGAKNPYPARALRRSFVLWASAGTDVACSLAAAPFRPGADPYI